MKTNPIRTQTNPISAQKMPKQSQFKPKQSQFQEQKMLRLTINTRRKSLGYYADEIEAPNAYDDKAVELFGEFAYLNLPERM